MTEPRWGRVYRWGRVGTLGASFPARRSNEEAILSDPTPDTVPAELAPFLAQARTGLEAATDGLQPEDAIEHLKTTLVRTEIEASRLGIRFDRDVLDADAETLQQADGLGPVVVIRRLVEDPDD